MIPSLSNTAGSRTRRLAPGALLCACLAALLLAGCSDDKYKAPETENILLFGNGTEPQDLDPHVVTGIPERHIINSLMEGLVRLDQKTLAVHPAVAESWQVSPDGLYYRFSLRKDARWSNGEPVTAQDFVYSWKRLLTPALGAQYASMLFPVKNARDYYEGRLKDFSQVGVRADWGPHLLEVTLGEPAGYFLSSLIHYSTFAVHPPTIEKHGSISSRGNPWTRAGNYVGNGPFQLVEWKLNRAIRVRRNPHYHSAATLPLDGVDFLPTERATIEERLFQTGQLHITSTLVAERLHFYRSNHPELLSEYGNFGTYYYILNTTRPPLDDVRVRQALSMALDRKTLVNAVSQGGEKPASAFTPPGIPDYLPGSTLRVPFDPRQARQLLAEAGFPDGKGFPRMELLYNTTQGHRKVAEVVQSMWREHLNIKIELHNQEWKVYMENRRKKEFDIARAGWIGDFLDPTTFLNLLTSYDENNDSLWSSSYYDGLVESAKKTLDPQKRNKMLLEAEAFLLENMPILPVYFYSSRRLVRPEVRNWEPNILSYIVFSKLSLEP